MNIALFVAITFLSSLIQGTMGIGFAIIYVTLSSFLFPYLEVLVSERLLAILFIVPVLLMFRDKIRWRHIWIPLIFSILGTRIALLIMRTLEERNLIIILGVVLALSGIANMVLKKEWHFSGGWISGAIVGVAIGVISGICGMAGPVIALYYLGIEELSEDKDRYFATTVMLFEIMGIIQTVDFLFNGYFPSGGWTLSLIGIVPTFAGMFIGLRLFSRINVAQVKKLLNWFMVVMGLFLFVSNLIK